MRNRRFQRCTLFGLDGIDRLTAVLGHQRRKSCPQRTESSHCLGFDRCQVTPLTFEVRAEVAELIVADIG